MRTDMCVYQQCIKTAAELTEVVYVIDLGRFDPSSSSLSDKSSMRSRLHPAERTKVSKIYLSGLETARGPVGKIYTRPMVGWKLRLHQLAMMHVVQTGQGNDGQHGYSHSNKHAV